MNHLKVAYSCDNGYIMQTGISMLSLFENNKDFEQITIYLVAKNISEDNIAALNRLCKKYDRTLKVVQFNQIAYDLKLSSTGRHIATVYAKIFFSRIEGLDKILYIDSDTVIDGSLRGIWSTNLDGYYMGMVETYTGDRAKISLKMSTKAFFFNDGVALCNVSFCRENNLIPKCIDLINAYDGMPPVLSEGVLNKICENKIYPISPRYNMMSGLYQLIKLDLGYVETKLHYSQRDLMESVNAPVIIHYLSGFYNRPWNKSCTHPLKKKYEIYKQWSDWRDCPQFESELPLKIKLIGFMLKLLGPRKLEKIKKLIQRR